MNVALAPIVQAPVALITVGTLAVLVNVAEFAMLNVVYQCSPLIVPLLHAPAPSLPSPRYVELGGVVKLLLKLYPFHLSCCPACS